MQSALSPSRQHLMSMFIRSSRPRNPVALRSNMFTATTKNARSASRVTVPRHFTSPTGLRSARPRPRHVRRNHTDSPSQPPRPDATSQLGSPASTPSPSLGERLRKLTREYGWAATGVYLGLSVLDFPFCFLAVRALGTERIAKVEHVVVTTSKRVAKVPLEYFGLVTPEDEAAGAANTSGGIFPEDKDTPQEVGWGVEEAEKNYHDQAGLGTQLALAYAIHKSFIFLRIPLTAAVTPRVVKTLRGWGWDIGRRKTKAKAAGAVTSSK